MTSTDSTKSYLKSFASFYFEYLYLNGKTSLWYGDLLQNWVSMPLNVIATLLERTSKQNTKQTNNKWKEREGKIKKRKKKDQSSIKDETEAKYKMSEIREEY